MCIPALLFCRFIFPRQFCLKVVLNCFDFFVKHYKD